MSLKSEILAQIAQVAAEHDKSLASLTEDLPLLHTGLDSLCLAVVVARLEDAFNVDPFSKDDAAGFPVTVGDFIRLYENALAAPVRDVRDHPILIEEPTL